MALANDPPHHLYVCPPCSAEFRRHIAFRDYLRAHPNDAKAYGDLKVLLAARFREDRSAYIAGKDEFVAERTRRAVAHIYLYKLMIINYLAIYCHCLTSTVTRP